MKKLLLAGKKQVILPQIPETLVWVIKLVMVIPKSIFFFSFSKFPVHSSGLCADVNLVSSAYSFVYFFSLFFSSFIPILKSSIHCSYVCPISDRYLV